MTLDEKQIFAKALFTQVLKSVSCRYTPIKQTLTMPQTELIALTPPFYQDAFTDADSSDALQNYLQTYSTLGVSFDGKQSEAQLSFADVELEQVPKQPTYCVVSQSLSLRKLVIVLAQLYPPQSKLQIRANPYAQEFASIAVDVFADTPAIASKQKIAELCKQYRVDILGKAQTSLQTPGLLVMDMDSTIIAMECIDEIAGLAGVKDKVSEVTERAMRGEIPFTQSLHARVACLKGVAESDLLNIRDRLPFMPGFVKTMHILKQANWRLAVASGGFTFFADYVKQVASLDEAFSNQLAVENGMLTGEVVGKVVDGNEKARILLSLAEQYGIEQKQCVAIGDGANDLLMMQEAGTAIAYHAKPSVSDAADSAIRYCGFEGLLYALF